MRRAVSNVRLEERLSLRVTPLAVIESGQIVHAGQRVDMLLAEDAQASFERAAVKRLGFAASAEDVVHRCEVIDPGEGFAMVLPQHSFAEREALFRRDAASAYLPASCSRSACRFSSSISATLPPCAPAPVDNATASIAAAMTPMVARRA
jgi:hypothetical protein